MNKLHLILHTIIHLRPIQIRYQLWYRLRKIWRKVTGFKYPLSIPKDGHPLQFKPWIEKPTSFEKNVFTFLNITNSYPPPLGGKLDRSSINWNESKFGKLWTYNLNYFDYLLQPNMDVEAGKLLIDNFIQNAKQNSTGIEPYPIALRGINWIKFFSKYSLQNTHYSNSLYAQYQILLNNLEFHLLGNHLLEDGFSLLFGAFYFTDEKLYNKAVEILKSEELREQILEDGGHFELSPMYHQIILDRLLDSINLLQNNKQFKSQEQLLSLMQEKAQNMLIWLNTITFSNGEIPLLNDSAKGIAPSTQQLNNYASFLNLRPETCDPKPATRNLQPGTWNLKLGSSGYRRFNSTNYECILDIGQIGPTYQPGHAHADTFNFVLNSNNEPLIIDPGISTYEANKTRLVERGTETHNTVTVFGNNSSEVWSSFRVAQRAKVKITTDNKNRVIAEHNGYRRHRIIHQRSWTFGEKEIRITDKLSSKNGNGTAHFWFAPSVVPVLENNVVRFEGAQILFSTYNKIELLKVLIPNGFNQYQESHKIEVSFKEQITTTINIC